MRTIIFLIIMMMAFSACRDRNVRDWSDEQIEKWFTASPWSDGLGLTLDGSINLRLFAEQAMANPASWDAAWRFLKENDLNELAEGRYELGEDGVYATVTDYMTKDSAVFEAHKRFIDIQHVSKGREYIDVSPLGEVSSYVQVYDPDQDIEFFEKDDFLRVEADPSNYLVLFPSDAHRPCMHIEESLEVRKIVIKIPYIQIEDNHESVQ